MTTNPFFMHMRIILGGALLLLALACGRNNESKAVDRVVDMEMSGPVAPPAEEAPGPGYKSDTPSVQRAISSSAARVDATDTVHRFIRTADLRFRVKDVVNATLGMEDIAGAYHGWVTSTALRSETRGEEQTPISADSTLITTRYDLVNEMVLRVPAAELDSTLRAIGRWVEVFDHRTITANDVHLGLLRNAMAQRRAGTQAGRLANAIDEQGRKLKETANAEEALANTEERRDEAILSNLELEDRIAFATVQLHLYQRTLVRQELVANEKNIERFRPSLFSRIGHALRDGWHMLEAVLVGLLKVWPLLLVGVFAFLLVRRLRS